MDLVEIRLLGVLGILVVGVVASVGAVFVSLTVARLAQPGLAVARWLGRIRGRATGVGARVAESVATRSPEGNVRVDASADHALLARQAWWRLRS